MSKPIPPLHSARPAMDQTCGYGPGGDNYCGKPATTHLIWTEETDNSLACDEHAALSRERWSVYDEHPIGAVCTMPETLLFWSWEEPPGCCKWRVDDDDLVAMDAAREPIEMSS